MFNVLAVRVFLVVEEEECLSGHVRCRCWLHLEKTNYHCGHVFVCSCCLNVKPRRLRLKTHENEIMRCSSNRLDVGVRQLRVLPLSHCT